ncbi:MAG: hypothetical protein KOO66_07235 [Bacteroidales bacterium]|nr:hypothetical protein [Bacteroidales bacterium]
MQTIEFGRYYHIYNRGINSGNLFEENTNYEHFLKLYEKYINPIADTYAWCLMKNHFHFLVRIKDAVEIGFYKKLNLTGLTTLSSFKQPLTCQSAQHLTVSKHQLLPNIYHIFSILTQDISIKNIIEPELYMKDLFIE